MQYGLFHLRVLRALKDPLDHKALRGLRDHKGFKVHKVLRVRQA
jgi:hypothetical protein